MPIYYVTSNKAKKQRRLIFLVKSTDFWRKYGANFFKNTYFGANWRKFFDTFAHFQTFKNRYEKPPETSHINGFQRYINVCI